MSRIANIRLDVPAMSTPRDGKRERSRDLVPAFGHWFRGEAMRCGHAGCDADYASHQREPTACRGVERGRVRPSGARRMVVVERAEEEWEGC